MAAWAPDPEWGELKKQVIPPVRRSGHRRRAKPIGMHIFNLPVEERIMTNAISRAGRRPA